MKTKNPVVKYNVVLETKFGILTVPIEGTKDTTKSELDAKAIEVLRAAIPYTRFKDFYQVPLAIL